MQSKYIMPTRAIIAQVPGLAASRLKAEQHRNRTKAQTYDHTWRKLSIRFRQQNPLCAICLANDLVTLATEVDHITPIKHEPERKLDWSNLQSLCHSCHSRKTANENN